MHSFHTLLADLSAVAVNEISIGESIKLVTAPTPTQQKAHTQHFRDVMPMQSWCIFPGYQYPGCMFPADIVTSATNTTIHYWHRGIPNASAGTYPTGVSSPVSLTRNGPAP